MKLLRVRGFLKRITTLLVILTIPCTIVLIQVIQQPSLPKIPRTSITKLLGFEELTSTSPLQRESSTFLPVHSHFTKEVLAQPLQTDKAVTAPPFTPRCNKYYEDAHEDSDLLVIPRRAYYDNRHAWRPKKGNVVIILAEMSDLALKTIKSCEINGFYADSLTKLREDTHWVRSKFPFYTYSLVFVECINVPSAALVDGAQVYLIHKQVGDDCYSRVRSEHPLVVKQAKPGFIERGAESAVVCVAVFSLPPFFNEWLKYQKHIGMDLVHIAADASFSTNATSVYPFLKEALDSGFARMEVWKKPLGKKIFYYSQLLKYQDCVMQYLGIFQYAFLLDSDEFFTPLTPKKKSIGYYMHNFFSEESVATVCFKWIKYFCQVHPSRVPDTGNLTATLDDYKQHKVRPEEKCAHRLSAVLFVGVHLAFKVKNGFHTEHVSHLAYIAHIKPKRQC